MTKRYFIGKQQQVNWSSGIEQKIGNELRTKANSGQEFWGLAGRRASQLF